MSCEDAHGPVAGYTYRLTSLSQNDQTGNVAAANEVIISNLVPCTEYNFQVAAVRDDETVGSFSSERRATTPCTEAGKNDHLKLFNNQNLKDINAKKHFRSF